MLGLFRRKKTKTAQQAQLDEKNTVLEANGAELVIEEAETGLAEACAAETLEPKAEPQVDLEDLALRKAEQAESAIMNEPLAPIIEEPTPVQEMAESVPLREKPSLFQRLKAGLKKTRDSFGNGLSRLLLGKKQIDEDLLEELETQLLLSDIGINATKQIIQQLTAALKRNELSDGEALMKTLKQHLFEMVKPLAQPLAVEQDKTPYVILMVGINGAGKTTTIGKIAKQFSQQGKKVMLAAGDTFRAAAVEQLQVWGERNDIPVIAQHTGADSASVIYDAFNAAKARGADVLIADTAGRLHTQVGLMEELKKVKRVMQKLDDKAPHEVMLVLDASIGQNALNQASQFHEAVGVTGITMTKLDGTAKGGILFAIAEQLGIPFRFIGVGEGIDDLRAFDGQDFVDALFEE